LQKSFNLLFIYVFVSDSWDLIEQKTHYRNTRRVRGKYQKRNKHRNNVPETITFAHRLPSVTWEEITKTYEKHQTFELSG